MAYLGTLPKSDDIAARGNSNPFVGRRDQAIFRLLIDTGGRPGEIAELMMDVDFDVGVAHVLDKGGRGRRLPFGQATALPLGP